MTSLKGISPLVATVLLIAATMSIAMILSFWASSFVQQGLPQQNQTEQQRNCQFADFDIYQCSYNVTNSSMSLILRNLRSSPIQDVRLVLFLPNNSVSLPYSLSQSLPGGAFQSYSLYDIPAFNKIVVSSLPCTGIIPDKEKTCNNV